MPQRVFFLDDLNQRKRAFRNHSGHHEIDFASTGQQAAEMLKANTYDLIFLDYDLGASYPKGCGLEVQTGLDVAAALAECDHLRDALVFIHSLSEEAAIEMKKVLEDRFVVRLPAEFGTTCLWEVPVDDILARIESGRD